MRGRSSTPPVGCYSGGVIWLIVSTKTNHLSSSFRASSFLVTKGSRRSSSCSLGVPNPSSLYTSLTSHSAKSFRVSDAVLTCSNSSGDTPNTSLSFISCSVVGYLCPVSQRATVIRDTPRRRAKSSWVNFFRLLSSFRVSAIDGFICIPIDAKVVDKINSGIYKYP